MTAEQEGMDTNKSTQSRQVSPKVAWIKIELWDYLVEEVPNQGLMVWHHVTPADGGYGQEVDMVLPYKYFQTHSAEEFWKTIAAQNTSPAPEFVDRATEVQRIRDMFEYFGLKRN